MGLNRFLVAFSVLTCFVLSACNPCTGIEDVEISEDNQYFTITYLTPDGRNYISDSIYDPQKVRVWRAFDKGPYPNKPYNQMQNVVDFDNGRIGPIHFTVDPEKVVPGERYWQQFVIEKDTFGYDTLRINYVLQLTECATEWQQLDYIFASGADLDTAEPDEESGNEIVNWVFVE